jgi:exonuclease VII small subunit
MIQLKSKLPWKSLLHRKEFCKQDNEYIIRAVNNYVRAIELLEKCRENMADLTTLADGYENDYIELDEFLKSLENEN